MRVTVVADGAADLVGHVGDGARLTVFDYDAKATALISTDSG